MVEQTRSIIHVAINRGGEEEHLYYGCLREVFEDFTDEEIGAPYNTFRYKFFRLADAGKFYTNPDGTIVIRKGIIKARQTKRGRKKSVETDAK